MKENWTRSTLGESVSLIRNGVNCKQNKSGVGNQISRIETIAHSKINLQRVGFAVLSDSEKEKYNLKKGDILFSHINSVIHVGKTAYIDDESDLYHGINLLLLRSSENVEPRFLEYYLKYLFWTGYWETRCKRSVNQASVNQQDIKKVPFFYPEIEEQKRIVTILDEAFAGIDTAITNTETNLANTRELFESYLNLVFTKRDEGWLQKTLRQVCIDFGRGKSKHRPRNDPRLYGGPYPFIQTGDVRNCEHLIKESSQAYNEIGLEQSKLWPKGTICITIAANIAETGILDFDACFPDSIIGMVVDHNQTLNAYVEYLLQSVKTRIKAKGKGSAQDNINLATFENELFPFPDLNVQKNIVENLHELSESIKHLGSIYQQKLTSLTELKQSLLKKAFSGELTANNKVKIPA